MEISVLLSIKPEFANAIFEGKKKFEFRRAVFKNTSIRQIYVYASKPVGFVIGEFEISDILTADPESLWGMTKKAAGISKEYFDAYFKDRAIAHALEVSAVRAYHTPKSLREMFSIERPPQSFMYV